ncbi:MAG: hypothetical protein AAGA91_17280 [Pseudomonadota bacterium]
MQTAIKALAAAIFSIPALAATDAEIHAAMSKSDDYSQHQAEFNAAGEKLVKSGQCSVKEISDNGAFWKSTNRKNGYFMYCKNKRIDYTLGDIGSAALPKSMSPELATKLCRAEIEKQALHGKPDYHMTDYVTKSFPNGRVGVTQGFTASNAYGKTQDYRVYCLAMPEGTAEIQELTEK